MQTIRGTIQTQPTCYDGRISFTLLPEDANKAMPCMSGADFAGEIPHKGETVALTGEHKADLLLGRTPYFVFGTLLQV